MSTLRQTADQIISASIQAVLPDEAVRRALKDFRPEGRVFLVAAGKAAWQMAHAAVSALGSFGRYLKSLFTHAPCDIKFQLANGLALSLEFKMAAEILKTVLVRELNELVVLGAVIILRALLSFLIHFEMKQPHSS